MEKEILKLLKKIEGLEERVSLLEKKFEECQSANRQDFVESEKKPAQTSNRDKTKYVYNGKILPKNRLVFAERVHNKWWFAETGKHSFPLRCYIKVI